MHAVGVRLARERRDDAESLRRVVQREADHEQRRQRDLVAHGGLADREPLGEVVQADPDRDQQRQPARGRPGRQPAQRQFGRERARLVMQDDRIVDQRRLGFVRDAIHPSLVRDEREQSDGEPAREQQAVAERAPQAAVAFVETAERGVDRLPRRRQDVPHEEQQDADRDRVEHHAQRGRGPLQPTDRAGRAGSSTPATKPRSIVFSRLTAAMLSVREA